jgi:hypothetical protein
MRRMKMAVAMTEVPIEKLPVPPKIYNLWWDFRFAMGKWALGFLFGSNGQTAQQILSYSHSRYIRWCYYWSSNLLRPHVYPYRQLFAVCNVRASCSQRLLHL